MLVHNCDHLFLPGGEKLFNAMTELKKRGVVKKIGVSVYNTKQIDCLLDNYSVDLVQLPINIFDQRLIEDGQLTRLKKHGIEIHARSIFLQGLILMPFKDLPSWFEPIRHRLELFHKEAKNRNMSLLQLALGFVQDISEIDKIVVGVNTLEQLHEIVSATLIRVNSTELSNISFNDPTFLNPSNWKV